jgi:glycerol-1-phosphate dehydrogenase [NAD(P)+]
MHELLQRYCRMRRVADDGVVHVTTTERIHVGNDASETLAGDLAQWRAAGPVVLIVDKNTRRVAGEQVARDIGARGVEVAWFELSADGPDGTIGCDDATIELVQAGLSARSPGFVVAVGSGTINDLVKMAAHRLGRPYACVATAPSMNGYTSSIAAILSAGVKTTQPCTPPVAVYADPRTMAAAPARMIASGIGDLYSKPVSNADWRLSHRLLGTPHSAIVMEIVEAGSTLLEGVAPRLPGRDIDAIARLTGALMLSGLAMQAAGTSGPASGGEHLISHYIDMTSAAFGESHDFHGCQVAVGTIVTSRLYEHVRALDPRTFDLDALVARLPSWPEKLREIEAHFGTLAPAVLPHASRIHPDRDVLRARLQRLVSEWDSIQADVATTLRPSAELEAELRSANCPTRFAEIGVDTARAVRAIVLSRDIRARYTILHLASELGVLDAFAKAEVSRPPA